MRYINCKIYLPNNQIIANGAIEVTNGFIKKITSEYTQLDSDIDLKKQIVIPGFIDVQNNGSFGTSFIGCTADSLKHFDKEVLKTGCTTYIATLITDIPERFENSITTIAKYLDNNPNSPCNGIHLEGPFLNPQKKGAHNEKFMIQGTVEQFKKYYQLSSGYIKELTYAPELTDPEVAKWASQKNILVCAGHTMAKPEDILQHKKMGLTSCTHIFNAMPPLGHHNLNTVEIFLADDDLIVQMIADKIHIKDLVMKIVYRSKPIDKLIIVTDAMSAAGLKNGDYKLGTMDVTLINGRVTLKGHPELLAGSALTMDAAFKNMHEATNASIHDLIKITSTNAATALKIGHLVGTIEINKKANFAVLDSDLNLVNTIYEGKII